ncbi:MAG: hypothetical protein PHQ36_01960 [Anaerolineales bacterium]|nr:hypothetical protein [Anaerolineales bacterium]
MQAATNTQLITYGDWTLRVRASNSPNPRLLLLLHGWTGDENSMWIFTRALSPDYWMVAPRAPHLADPSGFSWRPNDPDSFGRPSAEKLTPAAEALMRFVDDYSASVKINSAQFDVMGFSQGAAMTNIVGMRFPQRVRKMGVLAGFVPSGMEGVIREKPLIGKNVFVAHGTQDQLIPIDRARVHRVDGTGWRANYILRRRSGA